jgi:4-hydroxybenzoate polyprenyltransferase
VQWFFLGGLGIGLGLLVSFPFATVMLGLWVMGCIYNLKPVRSKDLPYVDVISEAVNNPLRLLAGWFIVGPEAIAPASLLLSYWIAGCYFMAIKRFAEYRHIGDAERAASYRRSFAYYTDDRLLISIMFYASAAMLLFGVFIARYRLSLVLSVPFVALVMALYLQLGLRDDSPVQNPEALYRQGTLMIAVAICAVVMTACLFVDFPWIYDLFAPTAPINPLS